MTQGTAGAELDPARIRAALSGDAEAVHQLVAAVTPVVQARVARALLRRVDARARDVQQEVADLTQEVFVALFTDDARALRAWDPALGLSLVNFVGLLAQRKVASIFRVRRTMPWSEEASPEAIDAALDEAGSRKPESQARSRELLLRLLEQLEATLSPRGLDLFQRLYVQEQSLDEVCAQTGLSLDAVYQWRSRLGKAARAALEQLEAEHDASSRTRSAASGPSPAPGARKPQAHKESA
jgi:RNA polymerase sigma-70 factor (ECF subfamily)